MLRLMRYTVTPLDGLHMHRLTGYGPSRRGRTRTRERPLLPRSVHRLQRVVRPLLARGTALVPSEGFICAIPM
jgi:hypothetical protein